MTSETASVRVEAGPIVVVPRTGDEVVTSVAVALGESGERWIGYQSQAQDSAAASIVLSALNPDGSIGWSHVVARGTRDGLQLGALVALGSQGLALTFRGDEGLVWVQQLDARGRTSHMHYLDACDGVPSAVFDPLDGDLVVAWQRPEGGAVASVVLGRGETRQRLSVPACGPDVSLASGCRGVAMACVVDGEPMLVHSGGVSGGGRLSSRALAHAPAAAAIAGRWALAWVSEDTGKLVMARALVDGDGPGRVAEVWAPLERAVSSAPALAGDATGGWIAWREERGPRPAVYLRRLDEQGRQASNELRVSDREGAAMPGRVAMASRGPGALTVAWLERRNESVQVCTRDVAMASGV